MSKVTIRTTYPIKNWERAPMPGQYVSIKFNNNEWITVTNLYAANLLIIYFNCIFSDFNNQ